MATRSQINSDGFGDSANFDSFGAQFLDDHLFVGTCNAATGAEVWGLFMNTWEQVNDDGFGTSDNVCIPILAVYEHDLYAGTENQTTGAEVWRLPGVTIFEDGFESGDTSAWSRDIP